MLADTGMSALNAAPHPPGKSFTRWLGSSGENSVRQSGNGSENSTSTVFPASRERMSLINRYPAGSTVPGAVSNCSRR